MEICVAAEKCSDGPYGEEAEAEAQEQEQPQPQPQSQEQAQSQQKAQQTILVEGRFSAVRTIAESLGTRIYEARSNGVTIAVKHVSLPSLKKNMHQEMYDARILQLEDEISILRRLHHSHIPTYRGCYQSEDVIDIWYDFIRGDSIRELYLHNKFDSSKISAYTRQILEALEYLHKNNVIHLDVSCSNILIDDKEVVKLVGFHFAQEIEGNKAIPRDKDFGEWIRWTAPEIMTYEGCHCGPASDIWSLGCTVLEMATTTFPYSKLHMWQAIMEITNGKMPMLPDLLSHECREFIETCLQFNPLDRPTASQLLCHPFVAHGKPIGSSR